MLRFERPKTRIKGKEQVQFNLNLACTCRQGLFLDDGVVLGY